MNIKETIRAEIERRTNYFAAQGRTINVFRPILQELESVLAFLDTLQEPEKPKWDDSDMRRDENELLSRFAFYTYKDEPDVLYLSNLFVEESFRNIGIGTKILAAAEKVAETIGAISICLKVKQDSPANKWYRKNGYGYVAFEDSYDWLEKTLEYMKPKQEPELPGIDEQGIPGRDFIPVYWVDACEKYGRWKIVQKVKSANDDLEEEIARYLCEECSADDEPSTSDIARHFAEWGAAHAKTPTP